MNTGTSQPKFDGRVDYDFPDGRQKLTFAGGYGGTSGIVHTGIGPFQIEKGSSMSYGKVDYSRGALRVKFFTNILDGKAPALLAVGTDGKPITFTFNTKTFDFEVSNITTIGTRNVFSYGGNIRHNGFDLSIAPGGSSRNEQGRLRPGRDLPQRPFPLAGRRPRRSLRRAAEPGVLAAHDVHDQAERRPTRSGCRTTRRTGRRR